MSTKNLYVGNLPFTTTQAELEQLFGQYGTVTKAQVISDRETGRSRGFGFVEMSSGADEAVPRRGSAQSAHEHDPVRALDDRRNHRDGITPVNEVARGACETVPAAALASHELGPAKRAKLKVCVRHGATVYAAGRRALAIALAAALVLPVRAGSSRSVTGAPATP